MDRVIRFLFVRLSPSPPLRVKLLWNETNKMALSSSECAWAEQSERTRPTRTQLQTRTRAGYGVLPLLDFLSGSEGIPE
jgi:hypothetical protein